MVNFASVFSCVGIMVLISNNLWSQVTGEWSLKNYPESEIMDIAISGEEVNFIVQSNHDLIDTTLYDYRFFILETMVNSEDELNFEERVARNSGAMRKFGFRINKVKDEWVYFESTYGDNLNDTIALIILDSNFVPKDTFSRPNYSGAAYYCDIEYKSGHYRGIASIIDFPDSLVGVSFAVSNPSKTSINVFRTSPDPGIAFVSSIDFDSVRNRFVVFHLGGISHLNDTLGLITRYPGDIVHTSQHGTIRFNGDHYYSMGATEFQGSPEYRDLVFQKYDTSMQILFSKEYGRKGMDDYPFIDKSMEISNGNYLVGGMLAGPFNFTRRDTLKFFLAKYSEQLEQVWYREYGGSHSYVIRGINVLEDGRILVYGSRVDNEDGIRYPYLMLLNEDGEITSSQDIPAEEQDIVNVFYNAGSTGLNINAIKPIDKFAVFTADGKRLLEQYNLHVGTHSFEMSWIPPGVYFYFASTANRSQSGKWIKH